MAYFDPLIKAIRSHVRQAPMDDTKARIYLRGLTKLQEEIVQIQEEIWDEMSRKAKARMK